MDVLNMLGGDNTQTVGENNIKLHVRTHWTFS